jgi:prepilin-type N-terminal cleavage/methylation domain-containing protein
MRHSHGFTLIELLIVVAVILIIAAIAIPGITKYKMSANEASAIGSLRAISTAELSYQNTYSQIGFAAKLSDLGGGEDCNPTAESACLIDEALASGVKAGYAFSAVGGNAVNGVSTTFLAAAAPLSYNQTGLHRFCITDKGVLRQDPNSAKSISIPTLAECGGFKAMQ